MGKIDYSANLTKQKFGSLTVLGVDHRNRSKIYWLCRCDCGNTCVKRNYELLDGRAKSCGCLWRAKRLAATTTHGMSNSPEYGTWSSIKLRCYNPKASNYDRYGAKGIRVCAEWRHSFEQFYKDMGPRPSSGHSLDRIDSTKGYSPDNCRWATLTEQARNKRSCRMNCAECARLQAELESHIAEVHGHDKQGRNRKPFSPEEIRAIRASKDTQREVAAEYGVSDCMISAIRLRKVYRHVV